MSFKQPNRHTNGKIQAPDTGFRHRYADSFGTSLQYVRRQSCCFAAKQKPVIIFKSEANIAAPSASAEPNPSSPALAMKDLKIFEALVIVQLHVWPVIQTRSFKISIGNFKAQRPYQMQFCGRGSAGSGNIAGIGGYLWVN